jgi:hypothetical protein
MDVEKIIQEMQTVVIERSRALRSFERRLAKLAEQLIAVRNETARGGSPKPQRRWQDDALRFLLTKGQPVSLETMNQHLAELEYKVTSEAVSVGLSRFKRGGLAVNSEDDATLARGEWKLTLKGQKAARKLAAPK